MSDSVRPHRRHPTRLLHPWDSPGKNTGVGCHFLLQFMKVKSESEVAQSCLTLHDPMDCSLPGSSVHGIFQARILEWVAIAFSDIICICIYILITSYTYIQASQVVLVVKNLSAKEGNARDAGSIPGSGRLSDWTHTHKYSLSKTENGLRQWKKTIMSIGPIM